MFCIIIDFPQNEDMKSILTFDGYCMIGTAATYVGRGGMRRDSPVKAVVSCCGTGTITICAFDDGGPYTYVIAEGVAAASRLFAFVDAIALGLVGLVRPV